MGEKSYKCVKLNINDVDIRLKKYLLKNMNIVK